MQISSERSESCTNWDEDDFFPFHSIIKRWFSEFSFHSLRFRIEKFRYQSIINDACHDNNILLFFVTWPDGKESWSNRIRKFNKIFKTYFNLHLFNNFEQVIPSFRIRSLFSNSFKLSCSFWTGVGNKVFLIIGRELRKFL